MWWYAEHAQNAAGVSEANMPQVYDQLSPAAFDRLLIRASMYFSVTTQHEKITSTHRPLDMLT